jgi:hypothetical protein
MTRKYTEDVMKLKTLELRGAVWVFRAKVFKGTEEGRRVRARKCNMEMEAGVMKP